MTVCFISTIFKLGTQLTLNCVSSSKYEFSRKQLKTLLLIPEAYPCILVLAGPLHLHKASFLCPPTSRSACLSPTKQIMDTPSQKGTHQMRLLSLAQTHPTQKRTASSA